MPLLYAAAGETYIIKKFGGKDETRRHLENLGFTVGGEITLVSSLSGNLIVKVKESRVAIDRALAAKIMI